MKKEISYTLRLQDWPVTDKGNVKKVLSRELNLSRKEISRLKFDGEILLNGRSVRVNDHMRIGDTLTLRFPEAKTASVPLRAEEPDILFEDEDVVVVNKPAGIVSHPVHGHLDDSMGTILASYYLKKGGDFVIRPIGRLDKDVSGAAVYGKNRPGAARLSKDLQSGKMKKYYTAFVGGVLETRAGTIDEPIGKMPNERRREAGSENGKPARTHYRVTHEFHAGNQSVSVLAVEIETGRTHQIRAHLASIGYPILGDELYGGDVSLIRRPALHCARTDFLGPFTRRPVSVEAPLPDDMVKLLNYQEEDLPKEEKREPADDARESLPEVPSPESVPQKKTERPVSDEMPQEVLKTAVSGKEAAVVEDSSPIGEKLKKSLGIIACAALVLGIGGWAFMRGRAYAAEMKNAAQEEADLYDSLDVKFRKDAIVEYGGDFRPEDYVVSANGNLTVNGTVDTRKIGNQEVIYILTRETSGGVQVRKDFSHIFTVEDKIGPEIVLRKDTVEISRNESYDPKENIVSVTDPVDGKLEYSVDDSELKADTPGSYEIRVSAADAAGNKAEKVFTVKVKEDASLTKEEKDGRNAAKTPAPAKTPEPTKTPEPSRAPADTTGPVITLGSDRVKIKEGDMFNAGDYIFSVTDDRDGNLPYSDTLENGTYTVASSVNPKEEGTYEVTVTAVDQAGNRSSAVLSVEVEKKAPAAVADSSDPKGQIYNFLTQSMNFTKAQACGILANLHRESRFNPQADNGLGYYGLCQWGYERKDNLIAWCEENGYDYTTIDGQLHFLQYEMPLFYPNTTAQLRAVSDDEEGARRACWIFSIGYEVSGEEIAEMSMDKAAEYYNE